MASNLKTTPCLTETESKLFAAILQHAKGAINTDWEAVAQQVGLKDGSIAKVRYRQIWKKKIEREGNSTSKPTGRVEKSKPKNLARKKATMLSRVNLEEADESDKHDTKEPHGKVNSDDSGEVEGCFEKDDDSVKFEDDYIFQDA